LELEISADYNKFSNEKIISLIKKIEKKLGFSNNIKILLKRKGSVLILLELNDEDAKHLIEAFNKGKLDNLNIKNIKSKKRMSINKLASSYHLDFGQRLKYYKKLLENGEVKLLLEDLNMNLTNKELEKEVILLLARINNLYKDQKNGIISYNLEKESTNKINLVACELIFNLSEEDFN